MSITRNSRWNLAPEDGKQFAQASFNVAPGQYADIHALNLRGQNAILVIKIIRSEPCSDACPVGVLLKDNCGNEKKLTSKSFSGRIGDPGEYIIARQVRENTRTLFAPQADVRVELHTLKEGTSLIPNSGFDTGC